MNKTIQIIIAILLGLLISMADIIIEAIIIHIKQRRYYAKRHL